MIENVPPLEERQATIRLKAEGFDLALQPLRDAAEYFDGEVTLTCDIGAKVQSFTTLSYFPFSDFVQLCAWVDEHVQALLERRLREGKVWVPLDLSMQIHFELGEIDYQNGSLDGGFSLIVLLNIGRDTSGGRVWGGFEAWVELAEIRTFCRALRRYIDL